jgi:hypothetical protein
MAIRVIRNNVLLARLNPHPFDTVGQVGVGPLMRTAVEKAKPMRPGNKLGICGERGGDLESVKFCHRIGLNYMSCSPLCMPSARLVAASRALFVYQPVIPPRSCSARGREGAGLLVAGVPVGVEGNGEHVGAVG